MTINKDGFVGGSLLTPKQLSEMKLAKRNKEPLKETKKPRKKAVKKAD